MRLELMIEGQEDVTWPQWVALAQACERHGVGTLFRSDHYLSADGHEERGSLETWATLAGLAAVTSRLRLGVLVSPATFRHPSVLAKNATAVDHISNGRVELGIGAGWNEREHEAYGFEFPALGVRLEMLEEQLAVVRGAWGDGAMSFEGKHYRLSALDARPKPVQRPHPPLIIGGAAKPRTARLAAQYADEYNTVFATPAECAERRAVCEQAWQDAGRDPATLTFSVMVPWLVGADARDLDRRAERIGARVDSDAVTILGEFALVGVTGTLGDALTRLRAYRDAGVDRIMLQHLAHDDLDAIALLPHLAAAMAAA
jgi:F420-dependent oxidoreductase-like protein